MKGIILSSGAIFVTDGLITVRLCANGECGVSPISYSVLEWDLRMEDPNKWDYLTEGEIMNLPNGAAEKILAEISKARSVLGL